jgi:hypothetical protein
MCVCTCRGDKGYRDCGVGEDSRGGDGDSSMFVDGGEIFGYTWSEAFPMGRADNAAVSDSG